VADISGTFSSGLAVPTSRVHSTSAARDWVRPDSRRVLQLVLAGIWLLDGVLQLQQFFFTEQFGKTMISSMAQGNPLVIAKPITWSSHIIIHNPAWTNAIFAAIQILLGLAIAWRPSVRIGLAASVVWALGVWWVGEGLGGVLSGSANPVNGAPGAVIIYALLAVLLWPYDRSGEDPPFVAARATGARIAKGLWFILWASFSYFAVLGSNRSAQGLHDLIKAEENGEPGWVVSLDKGIASVVDHQGLAVSIILAILLLVVAIGAYLPAKAANATIVVGMVLSLLLWVIGENFGAILAGGATDVNSGPLLFLLCVAFWHTKPDPKATEAGAPLRVAEGA